MKKLFVLAVIAALCPAQTFYPTQDAFVSQGDPGVNFGTYGWLITYSNPWSLLYRTLMEFDLTSIPPGTPVSSAVLNLYMFDQAGTDFTVDVHSVLASWTEAGVTWNNQPAFNSTVEASLPYQGYTWWRFNITDLVQQWVDDPDSNCGLILRNNPEIPGANGWFTKFYSRDTTINRPYLQITAVNIEENKGGDPGGLQVRPNPVREKASITFSLPKSGNLSVCLYDAEGRKIKTLKEGNAASGRMCFQLNSKGISAGVYFLKAEFGNSISITRVVIIK
jgi:hypothetical protein